MEDSSFKWAKITLWKPCIAIHTSDPIIIIIVCSVYLSDTSFPNPDLNVRWTFSKQNYKNLRVLYNDQKAFLIIYIPALVIIPKPWASVTSCRADTASDTLLTVRYFAFDNILTLPTTRHSYTRLDRRRQRHTSPNKSDVFGASDGVLHNSPLRRVVRSAGDVAYVGRWLASCWSLCVVHRWRRIFCVCVQSVVAPPSLRDSSAAGWLCTSLRLSINKQKFLGMDLSKMCVGIILCSKMIIYRL